MRLPLLPVALGFIFCARSHAVTLEDFATTHTLSIRTVKPGENLDLGAKNQTNNLKEGGNVLLLSGQHLTSLAGIDHLLVKEGDTSIPISRVSNLQVFLNDNELTSLPDAISGLSNITFLYLFNNRLQMFPLPATKMAGLQGIYLTGNQISKLPPELFSMHQLRKLQVSRNHLRELPEAIGNLSQLIHLNLSENEISVIPDSIGKLTELRVCDLSDNHIALLPQSFGSVPILYQLRLRNNPLHEIPAGFEKMPGTIDLTGTQIDLSELSPALRAKISTEKPAVKPKRARTPPGGAEDPSAP